MPTIDVFDTSGNKLKKLTLPSQIFSVKVNQPLMAQAVRVYLSNQRQAPAKTKRKGEISLSGAKIYRQKGTGRARHGDRKAPIFVKGAKAHGPTGNQSFKLKMAKKMKRKALFSALTAKLKAEEILIIQGLEKIEPKTKNLDKMIKILKTKVLAFKKEDKKIKITIVLAKKNEKIIRTGRNIQNLNFIQTKLLNTYQILNAGYIFFTEDSLETLKNHYFKKEEK